MKREVKRTQATRVPLQTSDQTSNFKIKLPVLQNYSDCPEVGGSAFIAAAIYGAERKIILLLEWSKNPPINQGPSGRLMGW